MKKYLLSGLLLCGSNCLSAGSLRRKSGRELFLLPFLVSALFPFGSGALKSPTTRLLTSTPCFINSFIEFISL
jgi:hypothetical protein